MASRWPGGAPVIRYGYAGEAEWSIATPTVSPLSYVRYSDDDGAELWLVYMFGERTGSIQFSRNTVYYRSVMPRERGRLFECFDDLRTELERIAALIAFANSHLVGDGFKAAA